MPNNPLLIFPRATEVNKGRLPGGPQPPTHLPSARRQGQRLTPKLQELQSALARRAAEIHDDPAGMAPEQVVVFETIGAVDRFLTAVRNTPGMSWLAEWTEDEVRQDEDFYIEDKPDQLLSGRLYLVMTNQQAIDQLVSLFRRYQRNPSGKFTTGLNAWKNLFAQLRDVRRWGSQDRLYETGVIEAFEQDLAHNEEPIRFEAELWCRNTVEEQRSAYAAFSAVVEEEGGQCVTQCCLPDIAYHAVLVQAPRQAIEPVVRQQETRLVRADQVMFFRPLGQAAAPRVDEIAFENVELPEGEAAGVPAGTPAVALLDGLPLENHDAYAGRLIVDDPDDWSAESPANTRLHGTAMASLIVRGELDADDSPLDRPIYVRPILKPDPREYRNQRECVPPDSLFVDLIYRSVRRIVEGEEQHPAAAPSVRVINLSIGDPTQPFVRSVSAVARLLDWLAHKYNLLFVVSAGNFLSEIDLGVARNDLGQLGPGELQSQFLQALQIGERNRKILSPAESINAITVGALHEDSSSWVSGQPANTINPYADESMPSTYSRVGPGFRRSIKPELLASGGRSLYRERLDGDGGVARVQLVNLAVQPGHRVAGPGTAPGQTNATYYTRGTSNAAALVTRAGAFGIDTVSGLAAEPNGDLLAEESTSVLIKALLVHGATWGPVYETFRNQLCPQADTRYAREYLSRFVGYGSCEFSRVLSCHDQQATVISQGSLNDGEAHAFTIPLPPSLSAQAVWRRLTITLAWNSPINPRNQKYRVAQLWFDCNNQALRVDGRDAWWQSVRRGTVQHEVHEGTLAPAYAEDANLEVRVNCKAEAGSLDEPVRYGLVATLEVAEGVAIPVYDEVQTRLHAPVAVPV